MKEMEKLNPNRGITTKMDVVRGSIITVTFSCIFSVTFYGSILLVVLLSNLFVDHNDPWSIFYQSIISMVFSLLSISGLIAFFGYALGRKGETKKSLIGLIVGGCLGYAIPFLVIIISEQPILIELVLNSTGRLPSLYELVGFFLFFFVGTSFVPFFGMLLLVIIVSSISAVFSWSIGEKKAVNLRSCLPVLIGVSITSVPLLMALPIMAILLGNISLLTIGSPPSSEIVMILQVIIIGMIGIFPAFFGGSLTVGHAVNTHSSITKKSAFYGIAIGSISGVLVCFVIMAPLMFTVFVTRLSLFFILVSPERGEFWAWAYLIIVIWSVLLLIFFVISLVSALLLSISGMVGGLVNSRLIFSRLRTFSKTYFH